MTFSVGVLVCVIGLVGFMSSLVWLGISSSNKDRLTVPKVMIGASLVTCLVGYLSTPTGMANMRLMVNLVKR